MPVQVRVAICACALLHRNSPCLPTNVYVYMCVNLSITSTFTRLACAQPVHHHQAPSPCAKDQVVADGCRNSSTNLHLSRAGSSQPKRLTKMSCMPRPVIQQNTTIPLAHLCQRKHLAFAFLLALTVYTRIRRTFAERGNFRERL